MKKTILIVDDDQEMLLAVKDGLEKFDGSLSVLIAGDGLIALEKLKKNTVSVVVTDLKMPRMDGISLLAHIMEHYPDIPVILITGHASIESAVSAMRVGAYDYITKPIVDSELQIVIQRVIQQHSIEEENRHLKEQLTATQRERFDKLVGKSPKMQKIYNLIEVITSTRSTVLISGESGTGKRMVAHAVHHCCSAEVRSRPFIEVSCGALTETLLESELFGHVKGAFTGAIKDKAGRFEIADGGTIFLDEIDAFSPALQVKLLRVLQEGEFERVGDTRTIKVDVRVIAATNQNLHELIKQGKFRQDLYYRLNIIGIELPPLRERREDIPLLVSEFIAAHAKNNKKKVEGITPGALALLVHYNWPGNIRELENVIERAVILTKGALISPDDFPDFLHLPHDTKHTQSGTGAPAVKLKDALQTPEKDLIMRALDATNWNRNETARTLGINRTTLYKKMQKYGLLKKR
ncbi:MAG: sigma-54 dependent transcriptional regulator [Candidatus Omnitrophica bacterium]|nr:sigma-54 dependent transcriptional regulator [Candidatus Omnitrophota bacterium]